MSRRSPSLPSFALLLGVASFTGCAPASAGPAPAFAPDTSAPQSQYGSHMTVGLRVLTDPAEDEERVHLVAVVRDLDGVEATTDLGEYEGRVVEEPANPDELLRVRVTHPTGPGSVTVANPEDGVLEVRHTPDSGEPPTVRRIPVRANTPIRASEPRVQQPD